MTGGNDVIPVAWSSKVDVQLSMKQSVKFAHVIPSSVYLIRIEFFYYNIVVFLHVVCKSLVYIFVPPTVIIIRWFSAVIFCSLFPNCEKIHLLSFYSYTYHPSPHPQRARIITMWKHAVTAGGSEECAVAAHTNTVTGSPTKWNRIKVCKCCTEGLWRSKK